MMQAPLKVIHRYRNSRGRTGYKVYIFLNERDSALMPILQKVKDLDFLSTLTSLKPTEVAQMQAAWGSDWYAHLFALEHLNAQRVRAGKYLERLQKSYPPEWLETHLPQQTAGDVEDEEGEEELEPEPELEEYDDPIDIEQLFVKESPDLTVKAKKADYTFESDPFEDYHDDLELKDVFQKVYVVDNPLFLDDTVFRIKVKICASIRLHPRFSRNLLTPSRIYMWGVNAQSSSTTVGMTWLQRKDHPQVEAVPRKNMMEYSRLDDHHLRSIASLFEVQERAVVKRLDHSSLILYDYASRMTNYELFMIDLYTQLNKPPVFDKNVLNSYVRVYFPGAVQDIRDVVAYLTNDDEVEMKRMETAFKTFNTELVMERNVVRLVEQTDTRVPGFVFNEVHVLQSVVQTFLPGPVLPLKKIYKAFVCSSEYPYIHLLLAHEAPQRRVFRSKAETVQPQVLLLSSWLRSASYGITVKVRLDTDKYATVTLSESGKLSYKVQYKEADERTATDVLELVGVVRRMLEKVNQESEIDLPLDTRWEFAFINATQSFRVPRVLNNNALTHFARYFYPYVAVVVDPSRSRGDGVVHLRYKRISNYGESTVIHRRIVHYLKNFAINQSQLTRVLEAEFNMTTEDAAKHVKHVVENIPIVKSASLRPSSSIVAVKSTGIGIEIQGRSAETYKVRVVGARSREQLADILAFVNRLLVLQQSSPQVVVNKLKAITGIAEQKHLIRDVAVEKTNATGRELDADRIMQSNTQYTRRCQNSGDDIRRPTPVVDATKLRKLGYRLNKTTGVYEKHGKLGKLVAVKVEEGGRSVFYVCDPSVHKSRPYIGILSKSSPPLPCCFKKNQLVSQNRTIRNKFKAFLTNKLEDDKVAHDRSAEAYIKQLTPNARNGRLHFLPHALNEWLQKSTGNFKQSRLESCPKGYLFVQGVGGDLVDALSAACEKSRSTLMREVQEYLDEADEAVFSHLASGLARLRYASKAALRGHLEQEPFVVRDLVVLSRKVNVIITEIGANGECFVRNPPYHNPSFGSVVVVTDQGGGCHIVVEVTKTSRHDKKPSALRVFPASHHLSGSGSLFLSSVTLQPQTVQPSSYRDVVAQVLNDKFQTIFVVNKKGIALPTTPGRCDPFLPVVERPLHTIQEIIAEYENYPWLRPVAIMAKRVKVTALVVEMRPAVFHETEVTIPVVRTPMSSLPARLVNAIPVVQDLSSTAPEKRLVAMNKETLKQEVFMVLRAILSERLQQDNRMRGEVVELLSGGIPSLSDVSAAVKNALSDVHRMDEDSEEWASKRQEQLIRLRLPSSRLKSTACTGWVSGLLCSSASPGFFIPGNWYDEFIVRIALQLIRNQAPGKEILRVDRYMVADDCEAGSRDREESELAIVGPVNVKAVVRILYGEDAVSFLAETTKGTGAATARPAEFRITELPDYYVQNITSREDMVLRGLVSCLYHLIHRIEHGMDLATIGATEDIQAQLADKTRGRAVAWLMRQLGAAAPEETGVGSITRETVSSYQHDRISDERWLFGVWVFHKVYWDMPVFILTPDNSIRYRMENGSVYTTEKQAAAAAAADGGVVLRVAPQTGPPTKVEALYLKG